MRVWRWVIIGVLVITLIVFIFLIFAAIYVNSCDGCEDGGWFRQTNAAIQATNDWVNTVVAQTQTAIPLRTMTPR